MFSRRKFLEALLSVYAFALLLIGLWPFNFCPQNGVSWAIRPAGMRLTGDCIAFSDSLPPALFRKLAAASAITVEADITPSEIAGTGLRFIVAYGQEGKQYNFALAQRGRDLTVFLKVAGEPPGRNLCVIRIRDVFAQGRRDHIAVVWDRRSARIYARGKLLAAKAALGRFSDWDPCGRVYVGNDDSGRHSWWGDFHRLTVCDRGLTSDLLLSGDHEARRRIALLYYSFEVNAATQVVENQGKRATGANLLVPTRFELPGTRLLALASPHYLRSRSFMLDAAVNVLGFVPLGWLAVLELMVRSRSRRQAFACGVLLGLALSLSIELLQALLPLRDSSVLDLINNTMGTAVGAWLCVNLRRTTQHVLSAALPESGE